MLNDKTAIPLRWAVSIIATAAGLVASGAIAYADNSRNTAAVADLKNQVNDQDRRILILEERWQTIGNSIEKLDRKLDRVIEKMKD